MSQRTELNNTENSREHFITPIIHSDPAFTHRTMSGTPTQQPLNNNNNGDMAEYEMQIQDVREKVNSLCTMLREWFEKQEAPKSRPFDNKSYATLYTTVYNMCNQRSPQNNYSSRLYREHSELIEKHLQENVVKSLRERHGEYLLRGLVSWWELQEVLIKWMSRFFAYLDKYHIKHHSLPPLKEAGLNLFRTNVFDRIKVDVRSAMLDLIEKDREGEDIDGECLRKCVGVFQAMESKNQVYENDFEVSLLQASDAYFQKKAQIWMETDSTPDYMNKAELAIASERERVDRYLIPLTEHKLRSVCVDRLLKEQEGALLEKDGSGCRVLLRDERKEDLARMFRLFNLVDGGLIPMAAILKEHITHMGEDIIQQRELSLEGEGAEKESPNDPAFVNSLLALHDKYKTFVSEQFAGNALFQKALKEAFEVFVNHNVGKFTNAEMLCTFCDRLLRVGGGGDRGEKLSESQIEESLEKVVQIFSYLADKDLFSEIYRNMLAKRILGKKSASDDAEKSMISKLKLRCGAQFTSKMEGMINDLNLGADSHKNFVKHLQERKVMEDLKKSESDGQNSDANSLNIEIAEGMSFIDGVEFSVEVLTTGHWPSYKMVEPVLPPKFANCVKVFGEYYKQLHHEKRLLNWVYSLGNTLVKFHLKKTYDLQVTTLQAMALLCFNGPDEFIDFSTLRQRLNLEDEVLKRVLHSLSCGKLRVLRKEPPNAKLVALTDQFKVNDQFTSNIKRVTIPMASLDESHNPKRVEEDRSIAIEAAIVRIMKSRKKMQHTQLISEVLAHLQTFKPNPKVVKKRIEHLIEREYLERDEQESNVYNYLA